MSGFKVAVAGATGNVGREMLSVLAERRFPASEVVALASPASIAARPRSATGRSSAGRSSTMTFPDTHLPHVGGRRGVEGYSLRIGAKGCVVIDNSSAWRMDPDVPLVVPEVNAAAAKGFAKKDIIANPNCSTAQLVVALKPLHDRATIKRVVVATYQSVSAPGKEAMDELFAQTRAVFVSDPVEPKKFPKRIAFNVIPQIDGFMDDGSTKEEWKMVAETKKILDPKIKLTATCAGCPCSSAIRKRSTSSSSKPISADEARDILSRAPGCLVVDRREPGGYIPPRGGGRGRDLHFPHPRRPDDRQRAQPLGGVGQSAERRGAQRGADRGGAGQSRLAEALR